MIKNRVVYGILAVLVIVFICVVGILPNLSLDSKNTETTYTNKVFNKDKVTTVDLEISEKDWQDMLDNPLDEEIKEANVTVNGKTLEHVGIRTKGNLSLREVASDEDSDRYSLKIDFDYYNDEQSLYGLKKLNLNNNYSDSTLMREYLSYQLMEEMGLPTPSYSYMYVTVNGEDRGLFLGVEQVDETFLAKNFSTNTGSLYKPDGAGSDLKWISDNIDDYTGLNAKTSTDDSDDEAMINFLSAINSKGASIEDTVDVDNMLRYFATNTALVNLDSYQGNMKHNYYLYEEKGKLSIIPWDYNMSFGGFGAGGGGGSRDRSQENTIENTEKDSLATKGDSDPETTSTTEGTPADSTSDEQGDMNGMPTPPEGTQGQPPSDGGQMQPPQENNVARPNQEPTSNEELEVSADAKIGTESNKKEVDGTSDATKDKNIIGKRGGMGAGNGQLISDSSINFSVTTPVSGTSIEERPLLNALLSNDEYRKKYEEYLNDIATKYLTEDKIAVETAKIAKLITSYVEKDPTKFYTTEEFKAAVAGDNSLPEFAKQRSQSILKQLSGDLVVDSSTSTGDKVNQKNQLNTNADKDSTAKANTEIKVEVMPNQPDGEGFDPNNMPERGQWGGGQPPNGMQCGRGGDGGKNPGIPEKNNQQTTGYSRDTIIVSSIAVGCLIIATIFVFLFKRRR
ncbi:CotH kinase family protein [Viridibacillus arvi]|uniref:CotH kinase family protein n=1 Tax=Viridibacillus arvi TaxID=263475 RepID=UPI0006A9DC32|nr:CotH kinase family protein [Viridibacillus arvi]